MYVSSHKGSAGELSKERERGGGMRGFVVCVYEQKESNNQCTAFDR